MRDNHLRFIALGVVALMTVAACGGDTTGTNSGSEELSPTSTNVAVAAESTTVPTTVPTTVTTEPEPDTTQAEPTATYTGGACDYDGPSEFDLDSTVPFTFINESDTSNMGFAVWSVPEGTTADEIVEKGIFEVVGGGPPPDPEKGFYAALFAPTAIDSTDILTVTLDKPGQHALNCFDESTGGGGAIMFTVSDN